MFFMCFTSRMPALRAPYSIMIMKLRGAMCCPGLCCSYTSYGRHFTLPYLLEEVNKYLLPFMLTGDTVVDFSCGYNVWLPMLKRMGLAEGLVRSSQPWKGVFLWYPRTLQRQFSSGQMCVGEWCYSVCIPMSGQESVWL